MIDTSAIDQEILNDIKSGRKCEFTYQYNNIVNAIIRANEMLQAGRAGRSVPGFILSDDVYNFLHEQGVL